MKKTIFRKTLQKFEDLAYAWGQELGEMYEYYTNEGWGGGYGHELCKAERWEWYEDTYEELSDILYYKQCYTGEYLCKVWEREESKGYVDYLNETGTMYGYC